MTMRSALRYRPVDGESRETAQVEISTSRASRQRDQSRRSRLPRPASADVQIEDEEIHTDDLLGPEEETVFHPIPERRRGSRPVGASVPPSRDDTPQGTKPDQPASRQRRRWRNHHPLLGLLLLFLVLWIAWSAIYGIRLGLFRLDNRIRFDTHPPTDTIMVALPGDPAGHPTQMSATNANGQITVTIIPGSDPAQKSQMLSATTLLPSIWGDIGQVVPALSLEEGAIQLTLNGDPQYSRLFAWPLRQTFVISQSPQDGRFQIVQTA
jgi:hypothetical protein